MRTAAASDTPQSVASQMRQCMTVKSPVHGDLNVTYAPKADASIPITPDAYSTYGCVVRTSSNFAGNARLTRKMSVNSNTIDTHQITVTAAWNSQYARWLLFPLTHGLKMATTKIDERTVCAMIAWTGTFVFGFTVPSWCGIRCSSPDTNSSRENE